MKKFLIRQCFACSFGLLAGFIYKESYWLNIAGSTKFFIQNYWIHAEIKTTYV